MWSGLTRWTGRGGGAKAEDTEKHEDDVLEWDDSSWRVRKAKLQLPLPPLLLLLLQVVLVSSVAVPGGSPGPPQKQSLLFEGAEAAVMASTGCGLLL